MRHAARRPLAWLIFNVGQKMKRFVTFVLIVAFAGCASIKRELWFERRSHAFQDGLYVADLSIPHLTKSEWEEIRAQFIERAEYLFVSASRDSVDRVEVSLALKRDRHKGVKLRFDRKGEKWVEDKAKAEVVEYLIP